MDNNNFYREQARALTEQNIRKCMDAIQRVPSEHMSVFVARETLTYLSVVLDYVRNGGAVV